jgi:hypothetical protein
MVSPGGDKIAFISNRNGIDNIYVGALDSAKYYAVTDILTGVRHASWAPSGDKIVFSAYYKGAFDIFVLETLIPKGVDGVLAETDFVKGSYDLLTRPGTVVTTADSTSDTAQSSPLVEATATDTTRVDSVAQTAAVHDSTGSAITTGIYGDEFVHVGTADEAALDSVLQDVRKGHDSSGVYPRKAEPAAFDSIPARLTAGEYQINRYKAKLTTDFVGGGFAYDTFFGVRGQTQFVFSDYLGNHQIYIATDLVNSLDQSFIQAYYFNNTHRTSLGIGGFHTKNFYEDNNNYLFSDRFYGVQGFASRPFSTFSRIETSLAQVFIDRKYYDRVYGDTRINRSSEVTSFSAAYVFDNVLWGYTAPMNGRRIKFMVDAGRDFFGTNEISFHSASLDYRRYWHLASTVSMAFRASGGASFGPTPKQYFLGGTTNWIGSRTLNANVYEVENLYFADVITPLRGQQYYGISGDRYGLVNWEMRFPLIQYFAMKYPLPIVLSNITGAIFTDIGAAWFGDKFKGGTTEGGVSRLQDIKAGFGCGMRINLFGFALLRYDVAWGTDFDQVSDKPTHYFSFGADF